MTDSYFAAQPHVTVAVAFDRHSGPLVRLAVDLARRLGRELCLLHVVSPWAEAWSSGTLAAAAVVRDLAPKVDAAARARAHDRLQELAQTFAPGVDAKLVVARGPVVQTLAHEAEMAGTCLLLAGADHGGSSLFPGGLGTGLALLDASPVPVMVLDTAKDMPDAGKAWRMLLADDLSDQSETAVEFTASLADAFGGSWVHHAHVSGLSAEDLRVALEGAAAAARTALEPGFAESVYRGVQREQLQCLEGRFAEHREYIENGGGKYTSEVVAGGAQAELAAIVKDMAPDVLIFGRHKAVHTKPFTLGRMPFRAMLSFARPVIVVPPWQ